MSLKLQIWVRNIMVAFLVAQLSYFVYQKFYLRRAVEWGSSMIAPVVPLILLQLAINKQTRKE